MSSTADGPQRHLRAFGLEIETSVCPLWLSASPGGEGPRTSLRLADTAEVERGWPADGTTRLFDEAPGTRLERAIDVHPQAGYRLFARGFGLARISAGGDAITCTPPPDRPAASGPGAGDDAWRQFVVGRVLPWASVLRGYEALHASAVAVEGTAVAFAGPTGSGKTSLALELIDRGARLVTDDVLALDAPDGRPRAHPGPAFVSPRAGAARTRPADAQPLVAVKHARPEQPVREPLPLAAVYFLAAGRGAPIEPLTDGAPQLLLASSFVFAIRDSARLTNQLDVCAAVSRYAQLFLLRPEAAADWGTLGGLVREHLAASTPA